MDVRGTVDSHHHLTEEQKTLSSLQLASAVPMMPCEKSLLGLIHSWT